MSEVNYRNMNGPELLAALGDDAQKWAEAYVQIAGDQPADVEFLTVWFANAIEHSSDVRRKPKP